MTFHVKAYHLILSITCLTTSSIFAAEYSSTFVPKKIISGWAHNCILSTGGQVKCWGYNGNGALGSGSRINVGDHPNSMGPNLPTLDLGKNVLVKDMCAGRTFSCALTTTGRVKCWGDNSNGQLGQEIMSASVGSEPNQMGDNLPWTSLGADFEAKTIQCGGYFACAINTKGQMKCWGGNSSNQLGFTIAGRKSLGTKVGDMGDKLPYLPLPPVKSASLGIRHSCAATSNAVYCWGNNNYGQAGIESTSDTLELPKDIKDLQKVRLEDDGVPTTIHTVMSGAEYICIEYSAGTPAKRKTKCWGDNGRGQLGIGSTASTIGKKSGTMGSKLPELHQDSSLFIQVEPHNYYSCALKRNGKVQCWGWNSTGQLGLGDTFDRGKQPEDLGSRLPHIDLGLPALALSHGFYATSACALLVNHEIKCWGGGALGQLGYEDSMARGTSPSDMGENLLFVSYK